MVQTRINPRIKIRENTQAMKQSRTPRFQRSFFYGRAVMALALISVAAYGLMITTGSISSSSGSTASAQTPAKVAIGAPAPDFTFTTLRRWTVPGVGSLTTMDDTQRRLSEFRGRPVMLWLFATWCPTCVAGTIAVAEKFDRLKQAGIQIIQLKLYNNLGYTGPSVADFANRHASSVAPSPSWLWGEASLKGSFTYDPQGYPDIYFLIDNGGIIRAIEPAPHVTMDKIMAFAASVE